MLRDAETTSIAETKAFEEKMPSSRRNGAIRTMMRRTMPCNVSTCFLNTADQKGRNEDPASPSYINHAARQNEAEVNTLLEVEALAKHANNLYKNAELN